MKAKLFLAAATIITMTALSPAMAADEVNVAPGLTAVGSPLGLHGADPVALLDAGREVAGVATKAAVHEGVAYYFASDANLRAFKSNPGRYVPENGGFCTYGVAVGKKFDGDPSYAAVVENKLYVFLNEEIFKAFKKNEAGTIKDAAENWKRIEHVAAEDL